MEKPSSTSSSDTRDEVRRTLALAVRFLAPWIALVAVLNFFVERWDPSPHYRATYEELYANAPEGAETLVMGASNGKYGVDPRHFEARLGKTLNLCLNGCGPLVYQRWYEDIYLRFGRVPERLILVLNVYPFDPRWLVRRIEHDASHFTWSTFLHFAMDPEIELSTLLYNRLALTRRRTALWHAWFGTPIDEHVDMTKWYRGYAPVSANKPFGRSPPRIAIKEDPKRVEALRRFLRRVKADGVRVYVVNPPICLPSIEVVNSNAPRLREVTEAEGGVFLDYNGDRASDINQDRSLYMDWEHLNYAGSQRWSALLAADVAALEKRDVSP